MHSAKIWLILKHASRDSMDLVGQEVNGILALDESSKGAAGDEALDCHLNRLRVTKIIALEINQHGADGLARGQLHSGGGIQVWVGLQL